MLFCYCITQKIYINAYWSRRILSHIFKKISFRGGMEKKYLGTIFRVVYKKQNSHYALDVFVRFLRLGKVAGLQRFNGKKL